MMLEYLWLLGRLRYVVCKPKTKSHLFHVQELDSDIKALAVLLRTPSSQHSNGYTLLVVMYTHYTHLRIPDLAYPETRRRWFCSCTRLDWILLLRS